MKVVKQKFLFFHLLKLDPLNQNGFFRWLEQVEIKYEMFLNCCFEENKIKNLNK